MTDFPEPDPTERPGLEGIAGSFRYQAPQFGIAITVRAARIHSDGRLTAILRISSSTTGNRIPGSGVVNLAAPRTRAGLAQDLEVAHPLGYWAQILDNLYILLEERLLEGEPAEEIDGANVTELTIPHVLDPILPTNMPSILYGLGGVGKGWLALLLAKALITGTVPRGIPVTVNSTGSVLYLDWETCKEDFRIRWAKVSGRVRGIFYRRCTTSLADNLDYLGELAIQINPILVIVDSAGLAAGGDLNTPESAIDLFRAVRVLGRTTLIIAHAPKNSSGTVFGSAYFTNLARSVWEIRSESDRDSGEMILGCAHRKSNVGRLCKPFGLSITISDTDVHTAKADLAASAELSGMETLAGRIRKLLGSDGRMTPTAIAEATGISQNHVRSQLYKMRQRDEVTKLADGRWGLLQLEDQEIPF